MMPPCCPLMSISPPCAPPPVLSRPRHHPQSSELSPSCTATLPIHPLLTATMAIPQGETAGGDPTSKARRGGSVVSVSDRGTDSARRTKEGSWGGPPPFVLQPALQKTSRTIILKDRPRLAQMAFSLSLTSPGKATRASTPHQNPAVPESPPSPTCRVPS
jgi:hypothetical protein